MMEKQRGASFIFWLVLLVVAGFAITVGLRLVPIYMNAYTVETVVRDVAIESRGTDRNPAQIWSSIERRLDINSIKSIKKENFVYKRDKGIATIAVKYEVRTKLVGNLDVVAKFDFTETLPATSSE